MKNGQIFAHKSTARGGLDLEYLDETSRRKVSLRERADMDQQMPAAVRRYIKAHDGLLLANHGALTIGPDVYAAYCKMETIEHFAKISLVTRQLGRENLLSREEVHRLQELRGNYGIKSPAPICADGSEPASNADQASCQIIEAPSSRGARLVPPIRRIWTGKFGYHTASLRPSLRTQ